ncbi:hypothetical protein [Bacillus sp. FJAT-47783]|uniref:hypothetical protein n=1 Tax=Bacillus sp. FJAT-47783 TaxID=2922712 RepID=UPI001FADAC95|nr:hypothetical protein [Bacillus sp. FJAT-47783]
MASLLSMLTEEESKRLLLIISEKDRDLAKSLEEEVRKYLLKVNVDKVETDVYQALTKLEIEDIYNRCGPRRYKYVEPVEAAYEVIEETLEPFAAQMQRFKALNMLEEFKLFGIGLLKGIQTFTNDSSTEFIEYAPDDALEWFHGLMMEYERKSKSQEEIKIINELLELF